MHKESEVEIVVYPFRLLDGLVVDRAYENILEVINGKTEKKGNNVTIDYYEAARIAYTDREYMRRFIEQEIGSKK